MTSTKTVLLVDDIPEYLDTMELNLPDGCRALRAEAADQARVMSEREPPDVAVIDIRLSEQGADNRDGLDLLQWMQQHCPETAVVMISAYREFEYAADSLMRGARFFLRKPIQPDEFRETVATLLRREGDCG